MRRTLSQKKNGVTLIELLIYIAVWSAASFAIFSIYHKCTRVTRKASDHIETLHKINKVFVTMEKDIRSASHVLPSVGDFVSDEETLILKVSGRAEREETHYVIYHFNSEGDGSLERIIVDSKMNRSVSNLLARDALQQVRFRIDRTRARPLVGVDLTLEYGTAKGSPWPMFSFSASLRNIKGEV